jgi:hypothetical protein
LLKVVPDTPLTYRLPLRYTSYDVAPDDADHVNTIRGLLPEQPGDALVITKAPGAAVPPHELGAVADTADVSRVPPLFRARIT